MIIYNNYGSPYNLFQIISRSFKKKHIKNKVFSHSFFLKKRKKKKKKEKKRKKKKWSQKKKNAELIFLSPHFFQIKMQFRSCTTYGITLFNLKTISCLCINFSFNRSPLPLSNRPAEFMVMYARKRVQPDTSRVQPDRSKEKRNKNKNKKF